MTAQTTFEAAEPTCVNCNQEESDHCDNCEVCISGNEQVLFESMWLCGVCLQDEVK